MATNKKITHVGNDAPTTETKMTTTTRTVDFVASDEAKSKAKTHRIIAIVAWVLAFAVQAFAIFGVLKKTPLNMTLLIILIVVDLIFAVAGNLLWKNANKLDPASEQDKTRFFIQNQVGAILGVLAFLPLVVLILTDKNLDSKQKGIAGGIAALAMVIAGVTGVDFNPSSIEKNAKQVTDTTYSQVPGAAGANGFVYWTKSGHVYHLYNDCPHINSNKTDEIFEGTIAKAQEEKHITEVCKTCEARAEKDNSFNKTLLNEAEAAPAVPEPSSASSEGKHEPKKEKAKPAAGN